MLRPLLFLPALILPLHGAAQGNTAFELNIAGGKIIKHSAKFTNPIPALSTAIDAAWLKQTTGTQDWEARRQYPVWGVGATYTNYGIDSVYGQVFGLYPFLEIPIIRGPRIEWTVRGGLGIGYATRRYERAPSWDTLNVAIGSHLNNFTRFSTSLHYRLNIRWSLSAGLSFSHLSNGAIWRPNLGVNLVAGQIGLRYWPGGDRPKKVEREVSKLKNRFCAGLRAGMAFNEAGWTDGPVYPVYLGTVWGGWRYRGKNKVFAGVDYSYHAGIYAFQRNNEINVGSERAHSWKSTVFVGHEWMFGKLSFLAQAGVYIHEAVLKEDPYYEKLGYHYYVYRSEHGVLKEVMLAALLKTHLSRAELVEFGMGLGF